MFLGELGNRLVFSFVCGFLVLFVLGFFILLKGGGGGERRVERGEGGKIGRGGEKRVGEDRRGEERRGEDGKRRGSAVGQHACLVPRWIGIRENELQQQHRRRGKGGERGGLGSEKDENNSKEITGGSKGRK